MRQSLQGHDRGVREVLRQIIGVYSSHPSGPLSLLARVPTLSPQEFVDLEKNRLVLRVPAMRLSVHILPADTAGTVFSATVPAASDPIWEKRYSQKGRKIPPESYESWRSGVAAATAQPLSAAQIKGAIGISDDVIKPLLNRLCFEGSLLRVGTGAVRSNQLRYVSTAAWAGDDFVRFQTPAADSLVVLPQWDSYTMGYAPDGRCRFAGADVQPRIYGSLGATGGNALGTVLVNGLALGSWTSRFAGNSLKVRLDLFEKLSDRLHSVMIERFTNIASFLQAKDLHIEGV